VKHTLMMHLLGRTSIMMAAALLPDVILCLYWGNLKEGRTFLLEFLVVVAAAIGFLMEGRGHKKQLSVKEGAQFVSLFWLWLSFLGMFPFWISGHMGFLPAFFESVSALTTTGMSFLSEDAPYVMWFWRSSLGWIGGAGFLIMLVTVLPQVSGCFGLTLSFRRSMFFSSVMRPMEHLALQVLGVYVGITLLSWMLYALSGLSVIDALMASMLTVSTTGRMDVFHWFESDGNPWPECTAVLTMFLVCGNLLRYWRTFQRKDYKDYYGNPEMRFLLSIVVVFACLMALHLWYNDIYPLGMSLVHSFFHVMSFISTTGLATEELIYWPDLELYFLFLLAFVGGCMGSPTGGLKVMRLIVLFKLLGIEVRRTLHPHMVSNVVVGNVSVSSKIMGRIMIFFFLYIAVFFAFVLLFSLSGISMSEAVGIAVGGFTSLGTSLGLVSNASLAKIPDSIKFIGCFFMLLARMEIFAFLLLVQIFSVEIRKKW